MWGKMEIELTAVPREVDDVYESMSLKYGK